MATKRLLLAIVLATTVPTCLVHAQRDNERSAIKRGNELVAQAHYEAAIREYGRVSPTAELYAQALYNLGVCHYELWQTDQAINYYSRAIAAAKNNYPRASYALAVALEELGRFTEAREAYKESINRSGGDFAPALFRLGLLAAREGDYPQAVNLLKEAIKRPGQHLPSSHNNLGVVLAWTSNLKEAEHEFKIALRLTEGTMVDAEANLKLCRSLLAGETAKMLRPGVTRTQQLPVQASQFRHVFSVADQ